MFFPLKNITIFMQKYPRRAGEITLICVLTALYFGFNCDAKGLEGYDIYETFNDVNDIATNGGI